MAFSSVISIGIVSISLLLLAVVANWLSSILSKSKARSLSDLKVYMKKGLSEKDSSDSEIEIDPVFSSLEEDVNDEESDEESDEEKNEE